MTEPGTALPEPHVLVTGELGPALAAHFSTPRGSGPLKVEFINTAAFSARMGAPLLVAFAKCFYVLGRLQALIELAALSRNHHKDKPGGIDRPAYERNTFFIGHMMAAELYELAKAIQGLGGAGAMSALKDPTSWQALDKLRSRWHSDRTAGIIRNQTAHHHGKADVYEEGLSRVVAESGERVTFYESHDGHRHSGYAPLATDCLFQGLALEEDDYSQMLGRMRDDIKLLPKLLGELLLAVLASKGIEVRDQRTPPPGRK